MAFHWQSKNIAAVGVEDLVLLSKVSEGGITENLRKRYGADLIYTFIGPSLVAVNPYKKLGCFTAKELQQYHGSQAYENPPHIYSVAERMWQNMVSDDENQCVIISGESGAGKTESAKLIMNYIAEVSPRDAGGYGGVVDNIKRIILDSNPLLESFGNAKTVRNNNSSRFGKYFEINFSRSGAPVGGRISNFLLEKSRVVSVQEGERNFHIFYQVAKSAPADVRQRLGITDARNFAYLASSSHMDADGIDDADEYREMRQAMGVCGIADADQTSIIDLIGAILHIGNIRFTENGENAAAVATAEALRWPLYLLGLPSNDELVEKLTSRIMKTGGVTGRRASMYKVPLNAYQATATRDALAKALYARLFDYIVGAVNGALSGLASKMRVERVLALGVLDIYGFEIFAKNGFEQFCINYVNERLQQIFIDLTLRQEQEEYVQEGIQWTPIDYFNNKVVVDLIEAKKPPGIMAVLDDACSTLHAVNDGVDVHFLQKLDMAVGQNAHYRGGSGQFSILHYAGQVTYNVDGFTEANKDTLFKDLIVLMQTSTNPFIRNLFPEEVDWDDRKRPTTAGHKIRTQCQDLVTTLMRCVPSYVRCIKPNDNKRPGEYDDKRVEHQIRYLNLKENIRVRRAGFCYRAQFEKFIRRYGIVSDNVYFGTVDPPVDRAIDYICQAANIPASERQLGRTKLFIRSPESLFQLEELRDRKYDVFARRIQACWRRYAARRDFVAMKKKAADVMRGRKERRRLTLNRTFVGDYLGARENPVFRKLLDARDDTPIFSDTIVKFDRAMKPATWELVVTGRTLYFFAMERCKEPGPLKGQLVRVVKRKVAYADIERLLVSSRTDDFCALHVKNSYSQLFRCVLKTELLVVLSLKYYELMHQTLPLDVTDTIRYTVKKTTWQSAATVELRVQSAPQSAPDVPPTVLKVASNVFSVTAAPGLPGNTPSEQTSLPSFKRRKDGASAGRTVAPMFRCYKGSSASAAAPPRPAAGPARPPPSFGSNAPKTTSDTPNAPSIPAPSRPPPAAASPSGPAWAGGNAGGSSLAAKKFGVGTASNVLSSNSSLAGASRSNNVSRSQTNLAAAPPADVVRATPANVPASADTPQTRGAVGALREKLVMAQSKSSQEIDAHAQAAGFSDVYAAQAGAGGDPASLAGTPKLRAIVGGVATPMAFGAGAMGLKKTGLGIKLTETGSYGAAAGPGAGAPAASSQQQARALNDAAAGASSGAALNRRLSTARDENLVAAAHKKVAPPPPPPSRKSNSTQFRAVYAYTAQDADELSMHVGDVITVVSKDDPGWWVGVINGKRGMFPANYVEPVSDVHG